MIDISASVTAGEMKCPVAQRETQLRLIPTASLMIQSPKHFSRQFTWQESWVYDICGLTLCAFSKMMNLTGFGSRLRCHNTTKTHFSPWLRQLLRMEKPDSFESHCSLLSPVLLMILTHLAYSSAELRFIQMRCQRRCLHYLKEDGAFKNECCLRELSTSAFMNCFGNVINTLSANVGIPTSSG